MRNKLDRGCYLLLPHKDAIARIWITDFILIEIQMMMISSKYPKLCSTHCNVILHTHCNVYITCAYATRNVKQ